MASMAAAKDRTPEAPRSAWEELAATGYDMSLLEASLRLSPLERLARHGRFLRMVTSLRHSVEGQRDRP